MPEENDDSTDPADTAGLRKLIEKQGKSLGELSTENTAMKRRLAIYDAGFSDPQVVKALARLHEGEDWAKESLQKTVDEYGLKSTSGEQPPPAQQPDPRRELAERQSAVGDAPTFGNRVVTDSSEERLKQDLYDSFVEVRKTGAKDPEAYVEAQRQVFHDHNMLMADEI